MAVIPLRRETQIRDRVTIACKEWSGVCLALAEGRQTILLRKGGIAEDGGLFRPEFPEFWLYPTFVHQAEQGLLPGWEGGTPRPDESVAIDVLARVEAVAWLDRLEDCQGLGEYHVWTDETIAKRFAYRTPGFWVLAVRVFVRESPWVVPFDPAHSGCKSWVPLDSPPDSIHLSPALSDDEAALRSAALMAALGSAAPLTDDEPKR